ncbi:MAG TPA: hypothetical protein VFS43_34815 [Polyangiaceae bacterium]|nr:hypothetical protein [Polyangiaceae bacterium]
MHLTDAVAVLFTAGVLLALAGVLFVVVTDRVGERLRERRAAARLERRVRALAERLGWSVTSGGPLETCRALRGSLDHGEAELVVGCSTLGDWAWLTLRGGPWLPPDHEVRLPQNGGRSPLDAEPTSFAFEPRSGFVVKPAASFAGASTSFGALASRARVARVSPEEIALGRVDLSALPGVEGDERALEYLREGSAHALEWAAATAAWRRYR